MKTQGKFKYIYKGEEVGEDFWNTSTSGTVTFYDGAFYRATPLHKVLEKSIDSRIKEDTKDKLEKLNKSREAKLEELKEVFKNNLSKFTNNIKDDVITNSSRGERETLQGLKLNKLKPQISLLFKQFPDALEAIARCSEYGHQKYKETDSDFLNFKRVPEGSKAYADAGLRHRLKKGIDLESMLPHCYHVAWNALAELQLLIEEK